MKRSSNRSFSAALLGGIVCTHLVLNLGNEFVQLHFLKNLGIVGCLAQYLLRHLVSCVQTRVGRRTNEKVRFECFRLAVGHYGRQMPEPFSGLALYAIRLS